MKITSATSKSTKKSKQQQQQQQQQQQKQQQQQEPHVQEPQQQVKAVVQIERPPVKMASADFVTVSKAKLVMVLATCLLAALFACCSKFRGEHYDEKHELEEEYKGAQREQMVVRKYVSERLKMYSASAAQFPGANERRGGHMFAKLILNAYDRSYQHVLDAINQRLKQIKDAKDDKEALRSIKPAARMLADAYGRALESSQRYSVQIQEEIRRSQEGAKNRAGEMSKLDESLAQWHLEELADFEERLVNTYLMYALELEAN